MKSFKSIVLLLLFITFIFNPCQAGNKIRIMHWGGQQEIAVISNILKELKKEKGIDAEQDRAPSGNPYMEKVLTQIAGGSPPDVLFVEVNNFKEFALRGVLEDLTPYIENDKTINIKDYYPEIIDRFTTDGHLYVIPRDIAPICVVYYNKKIFDEAGVQYPTDDWDWNQFLEIAKKLVKKDAKGNVIQFGYLDEWPIWEVWAYTNGGRLVDDVKNPKKCVMDSKETIEGIQFRADLIHKYKVMPLPAQIVYSGTFDSSGMFMSGKVGMFYSGIWKTPFFREIKNFDWDVVTFPKGPKGKRNFPTGGSGYAIVKQSKNKKEAWEIVKRLSGVQGQKDLASIGLLQPAIKELAESPVFLDGVPKHKDIVLKAVPDIIFYPFYEQWDEINVSYIAPAMDKVWNNKESADKAMKKLVPEINKIFFK
jgi:ABC-type glycerol-3-phosphate transport system substrate-binding protein